jgi:hypothetical protein
MHLGPRAGRWQGDEFPLARSPSGRMLAQGKDCSNA